MSQRFIKLRKAFSRLAYPLRFVRRRRGETFLQRAIRERDHHHFPSKQQDRGNSQGETDDIFRFAPELFEMRNEVIAELSDRGFDWLSHYSAVDPMHDVYGIEVCGIHDPHDAVTILGILKEMFPDWRPGCLCCKDYGAEPGWKAKVQRDKNRPYESWETT